ncbi:hypothetical protein LTR85_006947 [Meristemomyces frigidus]|nr:hypothetical protein LTR85_006947 [Meristemomyces frigidus]
MKFSPITPIPIPKFRNIFTAFPDYDGPTDSYKRRRTSANTTSSAANSNSDQAPMSSLLPASDQLPPTSGPSSDDNFHVEWEATGCASTGPDREDQDSATMPPLSPITSMAGEYLGIYDDQTKKAGKRPQNREDLIREQRSRVEQLVHRRAKAEVRKELAAESEAVGSDEKVDGQGVKVRRLGKGGAIALWRRCVDGIMMRKAEAAVQGPDVRGVLSTSYNVARARPWCKG